MTKNISEDSPHKRITGLEFGSRQLFRRPAVAAAEALAIYEIKVFDDTETVGAGDGKFEWEIPEDLDGAVLVKVEIFVSTVSSSGGLLVQIANERAAGGTVDMLSTRVGIDQSELNSKTAATAAVIDTANDEVLWGDHLRIDVDSAGTGAKGLGAILTFASALTTTMILRGVANWLGAWTTSTNYSKGDAVTNDGSSYVAIQDHTSGATSEPGTGANWQTYWMVLAAGSGGGGYTNYETRSSVTQLGATDAGKIIDFTAALTQTFDTDDNLGDGWWVVLRNATDDGTTILTLDPAGSETIDGLTTPKMYSGEARLIFCNGAGGNFNSVLLEGGFAKFTSGTPTFQVPHGITEVFADVIGGGGGGGGQSNHGPSAWPGGSGGGGGARAQRVIPAEKLGNPGDTISITVGAAGNGGSNADGGAGGTSAFGTLVQARGGAGGGGGTSGAKAGGGGGGVGAAASLGTGGMNAANATGIAGQGGGSVATFGTAGKQAEWGGGGGGVMSNGATGGAAGTSVHGGGGGGGAAGSEGTTGGAGGSGGNGDWTTGGGGAGGSGAGANGTAGADGDVGGGGGGAVGNSGGSSGGQGGAGGVPGGGGGGSGVLSSNTPAGGAGGRGEVRVYYS